MRRKNKNKKQEKNKKPTLVLLGFDLSYIWTSEGFPDRPQCCVITAPQAMNKYVNKQLAANNPIQKVNISTTKNADTILQGTEEK